MKEKSTILPYSIHKRIHVRPLRNLIQGIHVNVNTIQSTVLKEAAIRNSGLRHARAGPGSIRAKRRKESSGTPIIHDRSSLHTLHSPNQDGIPSLSESSTRYTLGNTKGASHHWNTTRAVDEVSCHLVETGPHVRSHLAVLRHNHRDQSVSPCIDRKRGSVVPGEFVPLLLCCCIPNPAL